MTKIKIGDLVSLKNHPYDIGFSDVKISALAHMTPPILVVSEINNSSKEFDTETGEEKNKQVKCIFYSHKSYRFESYWFNINFIKLIYSFDEEENIIEEKNTEIKTSNIENLNSVGIKYPKSTLISDLRNKFLNKEVILRSCDHELGKLKTTFSKTDNKSSQKLNSHLDFLPPVLTVIDVKINDEKISYNPKSGNQKKIFSNFLLKCKWYNSLGGNFSEEFIPIETILLVEKTNAVELLSELILTKMYFRHPFENHIVLENGLILEHSYIQPCELIFNHYKYKLKYFDFFKTRFFEIDLSEIGLNEDTEGFELSDFITQKIPFYDNLEEEFISSKDYEFEKDNYYRITYRDQLERITKRVIFVKEFIAKQILIADCLLRDGEERHFRLKEESMLKIEKLDSSFFA